MNLRTFLPAAGLALLLTALPACRKPAALKEELPATPPPAPETKSPVITSAEPTSYHAVSRHLDPGGWFYLYLSTEAFLARVQEHWTAVRPMLIEMAQPENEEKKAEMTRVLDAVGRFLLASGISDISGFGVSSIALEPGYYQTRTVLHHYEGKGTGFLWKLSGDGNGNAFDLIPQLPANTALAFRTHFTLAPVLEALRSEMEVSPELKKEVEEAFARFEQATQLRVDQLVNRIGPAWSVIFTLDESRPFTVPLPQATEPLSIPEPGLLIELEVRDPALLARLESELAKLPFATPADEGKLKLRKLSLPVPGPFAQPIIAWEGSRLIIATSEALWRETGAVSRGEKKGLAANPAFQAALKDRPDSATGFSVITPAFYSVRSAIQRPNLARSLPPDAPIVRYLTEHLFATAQNSRLGVDWTVLTNEGWVSNSRSDVGPASAITVVSAVPVAILAGVAVPNFQKARQQAKTTQVVAELKTVEAAIDQWAIEKNQSTGAQPTTDDLRPYFKPGTKLHDQMAASPGATRFTLEEGLPPVIIPKVGDRPQLSEEWDERYPGDALKPYRGAEPEN